MHNDLIDVTSEPFYPCQRNYFRNTPKGQCDGTCPFYNCTKSDPFNNEKAIKFVAIKMFDTIEYNTMKIFQNKNKFIKLFIRLFNCSLGKDNIVFTSDNYRQQAKELVEDYLFDEEPLPTGSTYDIIVEHIMLYIKQLSTTDFVCYNTSLYKLIEKIRCS